MGVLDKRTVSGGNALFEVTVDFHPRVLADYLQSRNGLRRHAGYVLLTLLWIVLAGVGQLSASEYFPELPLYPLPVVTAYVSLRRSPWCALVCAWLLGALVDSLWFARFGTTSAILAGVAVVVIFLRCCLPELSRRFCQSCYVTGIIAVFVYVFAKLGIYCVAAMDGGFMDLMPRHLLFGPVLNGLCLAPICFGLMDLAEWLFGLHPQTAQKPAASPGESAS